MYLKKDTLDVGLRTDVLEGGVGLWYHYAVDFVITFCSGLYLKFWNV